MSPEQLRGEKTDSRSDIWSLGVVIYEMITGQLPFKGDYEQAITYAILNEEPEPITSLRTGLPTALEWVMNKTLTKDPKQRYQHVEEIPVDLTRFKVQQDIVSKDSITQITDDRKKSYPLIIKLLPWSITLICAFLSIIVLTKHQSFNGFEFQAVTRSHIILPDSAPISPIGLAPNGIGQPAMALSPDGSMLVYVAEVDKNTQLYLHQMNTFDMMEPIVGTEGAYHPFFSPDGKWICFFSGNQLLKIFCFIETGKYFYSRFFKYY